MEPDKDTLAACSFHWNFVSRTRTLLPSLPCSEYKAELVAFLGIPICWARTLAFTGRRFCCRAESTFPCCAVTCKVVALPTAELVLNDDEPGEEEEGEEDDGVEEAEGDVDEDGGRFTRASLVGLRSNALSRSSHSWHFVHFVSQ